MITTENDEYAEKLRTMSLHGISKDAWNRYTSEGSWYYEILYPGYKYNLTDIAASLGIHQLKKCDEFWHFYVILIKPEKLKIDRGRFIEELKKRNVGASVHFIPLHFPHIIEISMDIKRGIFLMRSGYMNDPYLCLSIQRCRMRMWSMLLRRLGMFWGESEKIRGD